MLFLKGYWTALKKNLRAVQHLPEPYSESVLTQLSHHYHLPKSFVVCGAGTTELIQGMSYCHAAQTVLIVQPTYTDYEKYASLYGCRIVEQVFECESKFFTSTSKKFEEMIAGVSTGFYL